MRRAHLASVALLVATGCAPRLYTEGGGKEEAWKAPDNDWPIAEPPAGLVAEGFDEGMVVPDVRLADQFGQEVSLWQFWGQVVALDVSTMWCAPCQELASNAETLLAEYTSEPVIFVTILLEDTEGDPPDQADLAEWVKAFDISTPVLQDGDRVTGGAVRQGQYPALLVIDDDLEVVARISPPDEGVLKDAIDEALAE